MATRKPTTAPTGTEVEATGEPFRFTFGGKEGSLLPASKLPTGVYRKVARMENEIDAMFTLVEAAADAGTMALLDSMPLGEFGKVFADWQKHSGIEAGE